MLNPTTVANQLERLESDLATAEQDSRQKQARIERLESVVQSLRQALREILVYEQSFHTEYVDAVLAATEDI